MNAVNENFKNTEEALKLHNSNRGRMVDVPEDLTPTAVIATYVNKSFSNPNEVSMDNQKGDLELF